MQQAPKVPRVLWGQPVLRESPVLTEPRVRWVRPAPKEMLAVKALKVRLVLRVLQAQRGPQVPPVEMAV